MTDTTPDMGGAVERVRGCLSDGVTPSLASIRALLRDRDRLHAVYKAACATVDAKPSDIERALFELAAIVGAYEGGTLR